MPIGGGWGGITKGGVGTILSASPRPKPGGGGEKMKRFSSPASSAELGVLGAGGSGVVTVIVSMPVALLVVSVAFFNAEDVTVAVVAVAVEAAVVEAVVAEGVREFMGTGTSGTSHAVTSPPPPPPPASPLVPLLVLPLVSGYTTRPSTLMAGMP